VLPLPKGILSPELLNGDAFVEIYWRWFLRDEKAWQLNSPWRSAIIPFQRFNKEKVIGDGALESESSLIFLLAFNTQLLDLW